jgi:phospholipid N-methyltransferase
VNFPRRVEPEWLDVLAPSDPRAARSRRDLRRVNALMGNAAIVASKLRAIFPGASPLRIAEIGAGDGTLMLGLAQNISMPRQDVSIVLVDRHNIVGRQTLERYSSLRWRAEPVAADVFDWLARPAGAVFDVIVANLFLHHFELAKLAALLSLVAARTRVFVACEPRRSGLALAGSHMLWAIGCNDVSRHDAAVSVRAGFAGCELSALWPQDGGWRLQERAQGLFSHCFLASRVGTDAARHDAAAL